LGKFIPDTYADYLMGLSEERFDRFKRAYAEWVRRQLGGLEEAERCRVGNLEALDLEYKFGDVLRRLNRKASQPRNASFLARHFNKQEMAIIYSLLDDMMDASVRNSDQEGFHAGFEAVHRYNFAQQRSCPAGKIRD